MVAPDLYFLYNISASDVSYSGTGEENSTWKRMNLTTMSGVGTSDAFVHTGGGIDEFLPVPTTPFGSRSATMKPAVSVLEIPQLYIESTVNNIMTNVPLAGKNSNRYVLGVYIDGYVASDLYLEAWDNIGFATTDLPVLSGTANYSYSMINVMSTTSGSPPSGWTGATYQGVPNNQRSAYLAGYSNRVKLKGEDSIQNEAVYWNTYVSLPWDSPYLHNQPVIAFRYLYI